MGNLVFKPRNFIKGEWKPGQLNLLFVFQVNCPGCFTYGFPMMEYLHTKYSDSISFIGMSTAFEDFSLNTEKNTTSLIEENVLVGETQKHFTRTNRAFETSIPFPVVMDELVSSITPEEMDSVANAMTLQYTGASNAKINNEIKSQVISYLKTQEKTPLTFSYNGFKGTPTFVLFDYDFKVINSWFGHVDVRNIEDELLRVKKFHSLKS